MTDSIVRRSGGIWSGAQRVLKDGTRRGPRPWIPSGFHSLRARRDTLLSEVPEGSELAEALAMDRADLEAHVGGDPSPAQARVIESVLVLDVMIGAGLRAVQKYGPVDRRSNSYRPISREVAGMIGVRHRLLADLGLERRRRDVTGAIDLVRDALPASPDLPKGAETEPLEEPAASGSGSDQK